MKTILFVVSLFVMVNGFNEKYDLRKLPFDLRPVREFVGLWRLQSVGGTSAGLPPPDIIDWGINPLPKFGARSLNITHTYLDAWQNTKRTDYGYMPVKNASRSDTRVHTAYLTSSSWGFSMMEQGQVRGNVIRYHLKQFMRRTFNVGNNAQEFQVDALEREFRVSGSEMKMTVQAITTYGNDDYQATYYKYQ